MAYISTSEVKEIRKALKEKFGKNIKFGVRRDNYSSVIITLKEGVIDFYDGSMDSVDKYNGRVRKFEGYEQINQYHTHFYGKHESLFNDIVEIVKSAPAKADGGRAWYNNSDAQIDYFDTAFYMSINVGYWDKPYVCTTQQKAAA